MKDIVFEKIKQHFVPLLKDPSDLKFMEHVKNSLDAPYDPKDTTNGDKSISMKINDIEIFKIEIQPHLEKAEEPENQQQQATTQQDETKKVEEKKVEEKKVEEKKVEETIQGQENQLLKSRRLSEIPQRNLALDFSNNCVFILSNAVLSTTISLEYGFGGGNAISLFVNRVLSNFLFKAEQIVYKLSQIEEDLLLLIKVEFAKNGQKQILSSKDKKVDPLGMKIESAVVPLEYDIDSNYENLVKNNLFEESQGITFVSQKVDMDKSDEKMKNYFNTRVTETVVRKTGDENASKESLILILTPSKPNLDPIELYIIKVKDLIFMRALSSYFDFDFEFNISTKRFLVKNFEKVFKKIRDSIYENLLKLQEEKNRSFAIADCVNYITSRFSPLVHKISETNDKASLSSAINLKTPFKIDLIGGETDIELVFTTVPPSLKFKKKYPINSLYYSLVFFTSFINELYYDLSLVIPAVAATSKKDTVLISPPNNSYFKQMVVPFIEPSELIQDVNESTITYKSDSTQASQVDKNSVHLVFFRSPNQIDINAEYVSGTTNDAQNQKRKRNWNEIQAKVNEANNETVEETHKEEGQEVQQELRLKL